jgi:dinuclear metal center YbgI/SA1388 family protein
MLFRDLAKIINKILPPDTGMKGDRIGSQIESTPDKPVKRILTTLEVTDKLIDEAKKLDIDTIITFHPLIFLPLTSITDDERVGRLTKKLIKNDINLYSVHTSFDAFENGTSRIIADKLNLQTKDFLVPDEKYENRGMGIIGEFNNEISIEEFVSKVSEVMKSPLRYNHSKQKIRSVGILGGSGSSFIDDALKHKLDAFITADVSYHKFHYVEDKLVIADPGHYEMEQFVASGIRELIKKNIDKDIYITETEVNTNPVSYYPETKKYKDEQNNLLINK